MASVLFALLMINNLVLFVAGVWVLVLASKEGVLYVVLCLLVPFYVIYYVISRLDQLKPIGPVYLGCLGLQLVLVIGVVATSLSAASAELASLEEDAGEEAIPAAAAASKQAASPSPEPEAAAEPSVEASDAEGNPPAPDPTSDAPPPADGPEPTITPTGEPTVPTTPPVAVKPEPKFPPGFQGDAQRAFHQGKVADGNNFLRAALLTSDDKALWSNMKWCPALGRPVLGLRWGIGLQLAEPPPALAARGAGQNQLPNQPVEEAARAAPDAQFVDGVAPDEGAAKPGDNQGAALADLSELQKFTGELGPKLMATLPKSTLDRLLGPLGQGVNVSQDVQFVGVAEDARGVRSLAQQKGVDVLLLAAVSFKVSGVNRTVDASFTARLVDVATDKRLWASKTLSSNQVKAALNRGQDATSETIKGLADYLEKNFQLQDKPDLDSTKARQRADLAAREDASQPLAGLVEVRYYQLQELIKPLQAEVCYQRIVDFENAGLLANGTAEERRRVIERFLPRS